MKRKLLSLISAMFAVQTALSGLVMPAVSAEDTVIAYEVPQSQHETYNMNLDWKFFETGTDSEIWTAMATADKDGKSFYEKDYDDSDWETVSIPHAVDADNAFMNNITDAGGSYKRGVYLYRKTFTVPESAEDGKVFFELEGIRQAAYVWVNGEKVGYYEASITAFGFDITNYVTPGEEAVIAICEDGTTGRGTTGRIPYETVPGEEWGSSYTPDNYKTTVGSGVQFQWNTKDFNEAQVGLVYDAYLYVTGSVYQTFPLYNNLKTTGNYIYATDFDIYAEEATINVKAEIRNESGTDGKYTLEVDVVDHEGNLAYEFESSETTVAAATDAGVVYETAVESDVYDEENIENPVGITQVNTPDVTYITASYAADGVRFWSLDDPYLYTVYTVLKDADGNVVDVQSTTTGFRKVSYDKDKGIMINDSEEWLVGYAQRSTNEWAVIGVACDWLQDYDMALLKSNNANFIRWMHVAPKPAEVRSSDKYGVAIVCPAGDKEGTPSGRQYSQRAEAMRDAMIYFRNSPSVIFWETGNSAITADQSQDMKRLQEEVDPYGMRFIGARSTTSADQLNYEGNYAGTMYGNYASSAISAMASNGIYGPIMETEYARDESPRRVWDDYSPPDYDYVNKWLGGNSKQDGYDYWDLTQEEITVNNVKEYADNYYTNRAGFGKSYYSAAAMMVWSDSNMHGRNSGSENDRTSGRVDAVRQTKEMYEGTRVAQSDESALHIIGHWSYPEVSDDTYNYFGKTWNGTYWEYDTSTVLKRDPTTKTVYVVGSKDISTVELYRLDGETETLLGTDSSADSTFIYQFDDIDVTQGDAVIAKGYDARGNLLTTDTIERTYDVVSIRLTPVHPETTDEDGNVIDGWRADGSDIMYFDVEVIDENGNVCALNYDKITFTYEGNGTYLGGYNSGTGDGCFQNSASSSGISFYFGGAKDGLSTIGQDYVYAENGTNRIFVRSTREAGTFTLTARMDGMMPVSASITSYEVETEGGLTTVMPMTLEPGVSAEKPTSDTTAAMRPLMENKFIVSWANRIVETTTDENVYYTLSVNGTEIALDGDSRAKLGTMNAVYGPVIVVLDALKAAGANFEYTLDTDAGTLTFTSGGSTYVVTSGSNQILIDGSQTTEIVQTAELSGSEMFVSYAAVLQYISGVTVAQDDDALTVDIVYTAQ